MGNPAGFFVRWPGSVQTAPKRASNGGAASAAQRASGKAEKCVRGTFRETFRGTFLPSVKNEMFSLGGHLGGQKREKNKP